MKQFVTRTVGAARLLLKANAPTIMVVGGVTAMGVGTVLACRQTLKVETLLEPHTKSLDQTRVALEADVPSYTENDARKDRLQVYSRTSFDLVRLYAVPSTLFVAGIGLVFGGHRLTLKRNATLALAFTGLKRSFDVYRDNVRRQFGSEVDQGMMSGHVMRELVDPETGEKTHVGERDWDQAAKEPYNRVFGEGETSEWVEDLGINRMFIANQQRMANILLGGQGYLYLSDVYKALGFAETDISRVVGWKVKYLPDGSRDIPFVDFGLDKPHPDDWKYSNDRAIYLDFNCQGLIVGGKVQKILEQS